MTPTYAPETRTRTTPDHSSFEEFRSVEQAVASGKRKPGRGVAPVTGASAFWAYMSSKANGETDPKNLLDPAEQRALSKATGAAGGFLVPADFEQSVCPPLAR